MCHNHSELIVVLPVLGPKEHIGWDGIKETELVDWI